MNTFDLIRMTNFKDAERVINTLDIKEKIDILFHKESLPIVLSEEKDCISIVDLEEKKKILFSEFYTLTTFKI